jgi:hypothetical protein
MIYQHEARGADQLITSAIDAHVQGEQRKDGEARPKSSPGRANGTEDQTALRGSGSRNQNRL